MRWIWLPALFLAGVGGYYLPLASDARGMLAGLLLALLPALLGLLVSYSHRRPGEG